MGVAIVTGSNSGIGKEVVAGLLQRGDHVIMACRRSDACEAARADLLQRSVVHPKASCSCASLDLEDFSSIRRFAEQLPQIIPPGSQISLLVNNAGIMGVPSSPQAERNIDRHFAVNHLGTYLLTRLLLPLMAPSSRIVTVGSEAHRRGSLEVAEEDNGKVLVLQAPRTNYWYAEYARSKLGNSLMTTELSRQLQQRGSSVTTSCVSPGRVATDIFKNLSGVVGMAVHFLAANFFQTSEQGAAGVLRAAVAPEYARHVPYIHLGKEATPSAAATCPDLAKKVWALSNIEVGLTAAEEEKLWPQY